MANNVLANAPISKIKKRNTQPLAVVLIIILTIILIFLGEKVFADLNKSFNPDYNLCRSGSYSPAMMFESAARVYETSRCDTQNYRSFELMLHSAFAVPVLLGAMILYFFTHLRRQSLFYYRGLAWAYVIFALWLLFRLVIELGAFIVIREKTWGVYVVFIILIVVLTGIILFMQKNKAITEK